MNSKLPSGHEWTQLEVLDPVSVVRYMVDAGLKIDMKAVRKFWDHHSSVNSPWIVQSQATRDHVPLGLFGDAVKFRQKRYGKPEKMLAVFLNAPLWRPKLARASRWLLFAIRENDVYEHKTLDCIFHYLVWRLNVLHDGTFPITGRSGEPLTGRDRERAGQAVCNGLRFAITELRGDWLYHRQVFRMRSTWLSGKKKPRCAIFAQRTTQALVAGYSWKTVRPCGTSSTHWLSGWWINVRLTRVTRFTVSHSKLCFVSKVHWYASGGFTPRLSSGAQCTLSIWACALECAVVPCYSTCAVLSHV